MITHLEMVTIYYYRDALGFDITHDMTWEENFRWLTVAPKGGGAKPVLYRADPRFPEELSRVGQWTGMVFYTSRCDSAGARGLSRSGRSNRRNWPSSLRPRAGPPPRLTSSRGVSSSPRKRRPPNMIACLTA